MVLTTFYWILAALSLVGVVLNIHKRRAGFAVWMGTNAAWAVIDWQSGLYAQSALFVVYFVLAVWGWVRWRKQKERDEQN